jgi:hypothetical protein
MGRYHLALIAWCRSLNIPSKGNFGQVLHPCARLGQRSLVCAKADPLKLSSGSWGESMADRHLTLAYANILLIFGTFPVAMRLV